MDVPALKGTGEELLNIALLVEIRPFSSWHKARKIGQFSAAVLREAQSADWPQARGGFEASSRLDSAALAASMRPVGDSERVQSV
jgi:hypothetical protein